MLTAHFGFGIITVVGFSHLVLQGSLDPRGRQLPSVRAGRVLVVTDAFPPFCAGVRIGVINGAKELPCCWSSHEVNGLTRVTPPQSLVGCWRRLSSASTTEVSSFLGQRTSVYC
jgi:hypothetical protein